MKRGWIIAIVIIIIFLISIISFAIYKKSSGGNLDISRLDYSKGAVNLNFEGGANTLKNVETNPFRYGDEDG